MTFLRSGDWRPGAVSPALLAIQLIATLQAALRGLDYWTTDGAAPPGVLAVVEGAAPTQVWAGLLCGSALVVLLGLAGRWPAVLVVGHLMLAAVYLGVGLPVVSASAVGPLSTTLVALICGGLAIWALITDHPEVQGLGRILAVVLLAGVACLLAQVLGADYRTGTGLVGAGGNHVALAVGVILGTLRRRAAVLVESEQEVALC